MPTIAAPTSEGKAPHGAMPLPMQFRPVMTPFPERLRNWSNLDPRDVTKLPLRDERSFGGLSERAPSEEG
jgi:hypothetical protein